MSRMSSTQARSVDEYISLQPDVFRPMLAKFLAIVKSMVPEAEESISYQIPCFRYHYMLVGFGVNKKYCSFYTMSPSLIKKMKDELKNIKLSGATLHFVPDEKLPVALIKKIIKARMKENEAMAASRK